MPISTPSVHDRASFEARAAIVGPKAHVDFGLYGGAAGDNLDTIEEQAEAGAVAYKTFRTSAPAGREREFIGLCAPDPQDYRPGARARRPDRPGVSRPRGGSRPPRGRSHRPPGRRRPRPDEPRPMAPRDRRARLRAGVPRPRGRGRSEDGARPLLDPARRGPRLGGPPRGPRRDRRDLPALPVPDRRRHRAPRAVRQDQPGASDPRRPSPASGTASSAARSMSSGRTTRRSWSRRRLPTATTCGRHSPGRLDWSRSCR